MKKLLYIIPVLMLFSCSLEEESFTEVGPDNYVTSTDEAETVLMSLYKNMASEQLYSFHLSLLFPLGTDVSQVEGSDTSSWRAIPTNTHNPMSEWCVTSWQKLYSAIYEANLFIELVSERMQGWSESEQTIARVQLGEARTLRALFYFELVRWYGNIVLMKSTADSALHPSQYTQADPKDVYAYIEEDLKFAADVLPWAVDDNIRSSNAYRISKGSALGLLTKVYATWAGYPVRDVSKWADAEAAARRVVESGKHRLIPEYEKVWYNTCNGVWDAGESLIEVSFYSPTSLDNDNTAGRIGKWNGVKTSEIAGERGRSAGNHKVIYTFTDEWRKLGDPREAVSIADYEYRADAPDGKRVLTGDKAVQTFTPKKWDLELRTDDANKIANNDKSNANWYILRYSDVLLLFAEACNESGGSMIDAIDAVNAVRRRGFGDTAHDLSYGLSRDQLREAIRKERAYELCFEGHRKQDLIRWGIYYQTIMQTAQELFNWSEVAHYTISSYTVEGKHELMPIPTRDLGMMPQCHQNNGWGE